MVAGIAAVAIFVGVVVPEPVVAIAVVATFAGAVIPVTVGVMVSTVAGVGRMMVAGIAGMVGVMVATNVGEGSETNVSQVPLLRKVWSFPTLTDQYEHGCGPCRSRMRNGLASIW